MSAAEPRSCRHVPTQIGSPISGHLVAFPVIDCARARAGADLIPAPAACRPRILLA